MLFQAQIDDQYCRSRLEIYLGDEVEFSEMFDISWPKNTGGMFIPKDDPNSGKRYIIFIKLDENNYWRGCPAYVYSNSVHEIYHYIMLLCTDLDILIPTDLDQSEHFAYLLTFYTERFFRILNTFYSVKNLESKNNLKILKKAGIKKLKEGKAK